MRYFAGPGNGKQIVVNLTKGEDIYESLCTVCQRLGIKDAMVVGGIGSARCMRYHYVASTADDPENIYASVDCACEIGAMQGLVLDGDVHVHVSFSDCEGNTYNGHLEPGCEVLYLLEVSMVELPGLALKRYADAYGINYIDRRE